MTFQTLKNEIASDILDRTDMSVQIGTAINQAIKYYSRKPGMDKLLETITTFVTTSGVLSYAESTVIASGTSIKKIEYIEITDSSGHDKKINSRSLSYVQNRYSDTANNTGTPHDYTYYNSSFYLYPTPDASMTVTVYYNSEPVALSVTSDTNSFITDAYSLIKYAAANRVYTDVLKSVEDAAIMERAELKEYNVLKEFNFRFDDNTAEPTKY